MDGTQQIVAKLAQNAGTDYLAMQAALGTLDEMELLTLVQIATARAKNKLNGN